MISTVSAPARVFTTLALVLLLVTALVPASYITAARPPESAPGLGSTVGTPDAAAASFYEPFSTDVFASGSWTRSDTTVSVDTAHGWLHIGTDGGWDDYAQKTITLTLPIVVETRMRLVSAGWDYRLPAFDLYYGPAASDTIYITYASTLGWVFKGEYTHVHTKAPSGENVWMTVKVVMRSNGGELLAKYDTDTTFTPVLTRNWTIPNQLVKVRYRQHWDAVCDVDYISISGAGQYSVSGRVRDGSSSPISGVTISASGGAGATTDATGCYTITGLITGTYTFTPTKSGYVFSPPTRTVTVPPSRTGQDFTGTPILVYDGPLYIPANTNTINEVVGEADYHITMGDHVHFRLPFRNTSSQALTNAMITVTGAQQTGVSPDVSIHNGINWRYQQTIALTPGIIGPGAIGTADFWIYVDNNTPENRQSTRSQTWFQVRTEAKQWTVRVALPPIYFAIPGNEALKSHSCLHSPDNFEIHKYAQYAAGGLMLAADPPANDSDPDTPEQAIRNLVNRVGQDFHYDKESQEKRVSDTALLPRRKTDEALIGQCRHYADLTTGLLRALGFPSRYTDAIFTKHRPLWFDDTAGHAWVEAYLGTGGWRQVDPTWNRVFDETVYEAQGYRVKEVWADWYPLSSATSWIGRQYQCITPCYTSPVDCPFCLRESNTLRILWPWEQPNLTCVENVTSHYHQGSLGGLSLATDERLLVHIQAPTFVTRAMPFTLATGIVNSTTLSLNAITATVAISEYVDSSAPLFDVTPPYQVVTNVNPDQTVTVTWTITPLVVGSGIPLRVAAESRDFFEVVEQPLVVNELGTLPDLSLGGICGPGTISPGGAATLTAYVLGETLQPLTDTTTLIAATVYATPTLLFSATVNLPYHETSGMYQGMVNLPNTAPIGNYQVDFVVTHPGYEPDRAASFFFVTPPLSLTLMTNRDILGMQDTLTLTVQVFDRGTVITEASIWAELDTPGGVVTAPLMIESGSIYTLAFHPSDLAANLGGQVSPGTWVIRAMADYQGSESTTQKSIVVRTSFYLPLVLRNY